MLAFMDQDYPFSIAYGPADSREASIDSAQKVYERLMTHTPEEDVLPFETIALAALTKDGEMDRDKVKSLIRLFRPERDGSLSMLDFVKSCDTVYKNMRMLRASIKNSGQIDHALRDHDQRRLLYCDRRGRSVGARLRSLGALFVTFEYHSRLCLHDWICKFKVL